MPGLGDEEVHDAAQAGGYCLRPVGHLRFPSLHGAAQGQLHAHLLRGEEGRELRLIHFIEGLVRDAGARGDLGDREPPEPLLGDDFGGRIEDPFALAVDDDLARQVVAPAWQPVAGAARPLG